MRSRGGVRDIRLYIGDPRSYQVPRTKEENYIQVRKMMRSTKKELKRYQL